MAFATLCNECDAILDRGSMSTTLPPRAISVVSLIVHGYDEATATVPGTNSEAHFCNAACLNVHVARMTGELVIMNGELGL